jgi:hypothetical protein
MVAEGQPQAKKDHLRNGTIIFLVSLVVVISVVHLFLNVISPALPVIELPLKFSAPQ